MDDPEKSSGNGNNGNWLAKHNVNQGFHATADELGESFDHEEEEDVAEPRIFLLPDPNQRFTRVQLYGSMDGWREMLDMQFDPSSLKWFIYIPVKPSKEHSYKFCVNGGRWMVNDEIPSKLDVQGHYINIC